MTLIKNNNNFFAAAVVVTVVALISSLFLILISLLLLKGISRRARSYIFPYLIIAGFCVGTYFLQLFTGGPTIKTNAAIGLMIQGYGFVIIYSLYHEIGSYMHI